MYLFLKELSMPTHYSAPMCITPRQARDLMGANPSAVILDVRTRKEYQTGYIPRAVCIPESSLRSQSRRALPNKSALILVYCKGGSRSASACKMLVSLGYTNVYDFGGINSWPYDIVSG